MKAFLLAGGRGSRLRPLTDTIPKCLAPVNGTPLLEIWLELCRCHGVTEILLNVSHHAAAVRSFLDARLQAVPRVHLVVEPRPMGTAGTVAAQARFVDGEPEFLVLYADNLTDVDLGGLVAAHRRARPVLTMALFESPDPTSAGIVGIDEHQRVVSFVEKPLRPEGRLANAGVYAAGPELFEYIPSGPPPVDFGVDVLPSLVGRMSSFIVRGFHQDVGTPDRLRQASEAWRSRQAEKVIR